MKSFITAGLALSALPCALSAQDYSADNENRDSPFERCVSATTLVPPFNNTPGALEQSRVAATTVESIRHRRGEAANRVCNTSALAPEISQVQGIDEKPLTDEEIRKLDPQGTPAD
jgi:hypothetical protein